MRIADQDLPPGHAGISDRAVARCVPTGGWAPVNHAVSRKGDRKLKCSLTAFGEIAGLPRPADLVEG